MRRAEVTKKRKSEEELWEPQKRDRVAENHGGTEKQQRKLGKSLKLQPQLPVEKRKPKSPPQSK
jgi:hypothetical protein